MAPTPLAAQLAPGIQDALSALHRSVTRHHAFNAQHTFYLNMLEQSEPLLLPDILEHLQRVAPQIEVRSNCVHWAQLKRELAAGRIDFAIEVTRPTDATLHQRQLLHDELCVMAGPAFSGELTEKRYLAGEHVAVTSQRRGLCVEDLALAHLGLTRQVRQHCQHYLTAALLVSQSDLLLTMPRRYAELINRGLGNCLLPMPLELPAVTLSLYWSRHIDDDPANQWLHGQLIEIAAKFC